MVFGRRRLLQSALAAATWPRMGLSQEPAATNALSQLLMDKHRRAEQLLERKKDAPSLLPDQSELSKKIPRGHPRIFFRPEDMDRLRSQLNQPPFHECVDSIKAAADATFARPFPTPYYPADFYLPNGPMYDRRYPLTQDSMREYLKMTGSVSFVFIGANAQAYLVTGEKRYLDQARHAMNLTADLDPVTTSYGNTHFFHGAIIAMAQGLDYLWDALEAKERQRMVAALAARAREFYRLGNPLDDPLNNHALTYGQFALTWAGLALYHHEPEAADWLWDIMVYFDRFWPGYGGDDGGWANGVGYSEGIGLEPMHAIYVGTGVNFFATPWSRNNGNYLLYFQPPYDHSTSFGDASYNRPKGLQKRVMQCYASIHQNPYYEWYAEQVKEPALNGGDHALSHYLYWPHVPHAKAPTDLSQSKHFRDIDWVALHSNLADGTRNVMLQFKSNRFGSYNHSHADQNSFILTAFGSPLLIDSGYYPWYGSQHDLTWTRQTRAHNAILVNGKGQGVFNEDAKGRVVHFVTTDDFDYVAGDATAAYQQPSTARAFPELCASGEDVQRMWRHIVFIRSARCFLILDDVETERPASVQFLLHSNNQFEIDEPGRAATLANGPAVMRAFWLETGALEISHTHHFSVLPERGGNPDPMPEQWHLTCSFAPTSARRRLLSAIVVRHQDDGNSWPEIECRCSPGTIGARIGKITVDFDLKVGRVSGRLIRSDDSTRWFEYSL